MLATLPVFWIRRYLAHSWLPVGGSDRFEAYPSTGATSTISDVVDQVVEDGSLQVSFSKSKCDLNPRRADGVAANRALDLLE